MWSLGTHENLLCVAPSFFFLNQRLAQMMGLEEESAQVCRGGAQF